MSQISVGIRMDESLKCEFERVCGDMGLTMTAAFTVFAKTVSKLRAIPFFVSTEPTVSVGAHSAVMRRYADGAMDEEYSEIGMLSVDETAGIGQKWANPSLIRLKKNAWAEAAVEKERRRRAG